MRVQADSSGCSVHVRKSLGLHDYTHECKDPHMECGDVEGILPIVVGMLMRRRGWESP